MRTNINLSTMKLFFPIKEEIIPLLTLTIPLALTGVVQSAVWFFETLFLARLGQETLAAGSLVSWLFGTIAVILLGALSSINILVAYKKGNNDQEGVARVARDGLLFAALLSLPAFILFWNISPIFLLFGQSQTTVELATAYLHSLAWGIPANFITIACLEVIIGVGLTRVILAFTVIEVSLTIFWSYLLIFGKWGFNALGIAGAGWGLTVSYWITAIFLMGYILLHKNYLAYFKYSFEWTKPTYLMELIQVGLPIGLMYCVEVAFFFALTLCMGWIGSELQAANQVALQYLALFMSIMFAVSQAVTVRIGHSLGSGEKSVAKIISHIGIGLSFILMCLVAIIYWLFPDFLISIDFDVHNPNNFKIVSEIKTLLAISVLFQMIEAIRITLFGSLRGLKDTQFILYISIISFWLIALPLGYFLAIYLHQGGKGFWWGMIFGAGFSVILSQWRFNKKLSKMV